MRKEGIEILFFVDGASRKWQKTLLGKCVCKPQEILNYPEAVIIINSLSFLEIKNSIDKMGAKNEIYVIPYYWYSGTEQYPYDLDIAKYNWKLLGEEIKSMFNLEDEETKIQMKMIESMRISGKDRFYTLNEYAGTGKKLDYFCDRELSPKGDVTFIDVGAFQGETIEPVRLFYGKHLKKVIAFEPNPENRETLTQYVDNNSDLHGKVSIYEYALDCEEKTVSFSMDLGASAIQDAGNGGGLVECKPFDELTDITVVGDAMVKMDIEGAELDALRGMEKMIKEKEPYLSICLYHRTTALYDIPKYIKGLCPGYSLFFRGGWHLEMWAVPKRHFE